MQDKFICKMKSDIYVVYDDLNALLKDICSFLTEEVKNGTLSQKATSKASLLIQRSKIQLDEISKIVPTDNDSGRYVDMQANNGNIPEYIDPDAKPHPDDPQELYADIDNNAEENYKNNDNDTVDCPHASLPAKDLPKNEKSGYIERKEKFLSFIEHQKKLYGGICDDWLLLYYSDTHPKPFEICHLKLYEAKEVEKKEASFELIPKTQMHNCRTHFFTATTKKDMLQWYTAINRKSNSTCYNYNKPLPVAPKMEDSEVIAKGDDSMEIYSELTEDIKSRQEWKSKTNPILPPRFDLASRELPPSPDENYDILGNPDEEIYDQLTGPVKNPNECDENGYNSDDIYDVITPLDKKKPIEDDVEETYDLIQTNAEVTTPGPIAPKPVLKDKCKKPPTPEKPKIGFKFLSRK